MTGATDAAERTGLEVAIIGMAGRFPGARNLDELWRNLWDGVESITRFDREALERAGTDPELMAHPGFVGAKGVLDDIEGFDAELFGYTPAEAERMDPQIRIFHHCVWEALEAAGYDPGRTAGPIGLFAGASPNLRWQLLATLTTGGDAAASMAAQQLADRDYLCSLVAYRLGLRGPVYQVQTACSTSLVAAHLACQALLGGECKIAIAGGVHVTLPQVAGHVHQPGNVLSNDGHCRPFDADASGTVEGNGCGVVVLKLLDDALRDSDPIRAVIRGTAVNNDGGAKLGYSAPSVEGQARVIRAAHGVAGIAPASIGYIEAHGTATALGDPVEIEALRLAFGDAPARCGLGSIKSNIGHTGTAAGIAGLIKAALCLEHGMLPPTVHFRAPNPRIAFAGTPFHVVSRLTPWPRAAAPRRAGVSSFGIGGTNAHVVLEEAPPRPARADDRRRWHVLPLSARTPEAVRQIGAQLAAALERQPDAMLADVACTLQVGRKMQRWRDAIVCDDLAAARRALGAIAEDGIAEARHEPRVVWMFSGQGSQYAGMGRGLDADEPVFRDALARCFATLRAINGINGIELRDALYPAGRPAPALDRQDVSQPLIFSFEYALARLLEHYGVRRDVVIGYSFGEYVAACLAGVLSLDDALRLVALRGQLMHEVPPGAMVSVALTEDELAPLLGPGLSLAVANGPSCIVAGSTDNIARFEREVRRRGQMPIRLAMAYAGHSVALDRLIDRFTALLERVALSPPTAPYISSLTGTWITAEQATSRSYWAQQMRGTVRFARGVEMLAADPATVFVELGPGRDLAALAARFVGDATDDRLFSLIQHRESRVPDAQYFWNVLAQLWKRGVGIDWERMHAPGSTRRIALPTYPFAATRYPIDDAEHGRMLRDARARRLTSLDKHRDPAAWFYLPIWRRAAVRAPASGRRVVVVDGERGLGEALVAALRSAGAHAAIADAGPAIAQDGPPDVVIDLGALDDPAGAGADDFLARQPPRVARLVRLTRAAVAGRRDRPLELIVATRGAVEVTGGEPILADQAAIAAICRVLAQETPGVVCRHVDVDPADAAAQLTAIAGEALASGGEVQCAYRNGMRWVPGHERLDRQARPDPARLASVLRPRGVYLITGGLGGVGLVLARHLAATCQARLVLVSRTPAPAAAEAAVRRIEAEGGEVLIASADVGDPGALRAVLDAAQRRFGALHGVVHAAGVVAGESFRALASLRRVDWETQARAKIAGSEALAAALSGQRLDFVLAMSSISTVLGGLGFGAYVAANAYLEAVALRMRRAGAPWLSVAWDGWNVAAAAGRTGPLGARLAALAMNEEEGAAAFRHALAFGAAHLVHSTSDLELRLAQWVHHDAAADAASGSTPRQVRARPALVTGFVAPRDPLEQEIAGLWQALLGYSALGVHDDFLELGGDSLRAINLASRLHARFGIILTLEGFFERMTIAAQAEAVRGASRGDRDAGGAGAAAAACASDAGAPSLRVLQDGDGSAPIVLVHPVEGTVFSYYPVARALARRRVVALESPFVRDPALPVSSLGELAAGYADAVAGIVDGGPWWLGGWSMGATIALEMLRRLRERRQPEPAGLLLIDPWLPDEASGAARVPVGPAADDPARLLHAVGLADPASAAYLAAHADPDGNRVRTFQHNRALFEAWQVAPLPARGLLAWAGGQPSDIAAANLRRWRAITGGGMTEVRLAGDHYGIVSADGASALARAIEDTLRAAGGPAVAPRSC